MRKRMKLLPLILAFSMLLSLAAPAAAAEAEKRGAIVRFEDGADVDALCEELEKLPGISVRWKYEALFKGAAIEGGAAALKRVEDCGFAQSVALSRAWSQPAAVGDPAGTSNSLDVLRAEDIAYDGKGTVIAVIDSGVYLSHETFADYGLVTETITRDRVDKFIENGGTDGRYVSEKIPFAYDYHGNDRSVHTMDAHGTHVSALAVGYSVNGDGSVKFRGVAPAAQLLAMKVFPDNGSQGAMDTDILKAMEDAYLLGADIVNLSLGTEGDFMEDSAAGDLYREVIGKMRGAGIIVCCAAGNFGMALTGKTDGAELPTTDYTDYGTACMPAVYPGATAVASVNAESCEGGGGISVGEKMIAYTKASSDSGTEVLPDLDDLAGEELQYVVIGGLGREEDFAGLDLTGCVALVQRGETYFSEKTNNAAAAGAVACLIYNNEPGVILPAVEGTSIPCASISREDGAYMIEQAKNGRGTLTIKSNRVMVSTEIGGTMMEASSWGATSDLRLVPTMTAPGGTILSALAGTKNRYGYLSGTSMAAPNASGSFAVMMQALRERGVEDKKTRAELAEDLLASTAAILTSEEGVPLSPRRQGAGVIDLSAALAGGSVIRDPVLEAGESETGRFTLSFTISNLTQETKKYTIDTTVLTDAFTEADGVYYNVLQPLDITEYTAVTGGKTVTVSAGGSRPVSLTLQVSDELREALSEVYTNGFFVEGYVALTDETGESVHAAYMGYCGDWEAAPVIEPTDFRDLMNSDAAGTDITAQVNMWYNIAYIVGDDRSSERLMPGENPEMATGAEDARIAMSSRDSDAMAVTGQTFTVDLYTLRHAARVIMVVSNQRTGEIYKVTDNGHVTRSEIGDASGLAAPSLYLYWDGTDSTGAPLPGGTAVTVAFYAWTESDTVMQAAYRRSASSFERPDSYRWLLSGQYEDRREWTFPLVLDGVSPVISAVTVEEDGVALTVAEDEFLAYVIVQNGEGETLASETFDGTTRGESRVLTLPGGEWAEETIYIIAADYAGNTVGYALDLSASGEGEAQASRCAAALFTDVKKNGWYHEAVDFVCENGLMDSTDTLLFDPGHTAMRATVFEALYRLAGQPDMTGVEIPFVDAQEHEWYYDALCWAYENGVAEGYSQTTFAPLAPVSRQQLAVMLYRAAKLSGETADHDAQYLSAFADSSDVSDWAVEAMAWAVGEGIFTGDGEGNLNPRATATRAELAQILMNILEDN